MDARIRPGKQIAGLSLRGRGNLCDHGVIVEQPDHEVTDGALVGTPCAPVRDLVACVRGDVSMSRRYRPPSGRGRNLRLTGLISAAGSAGRSVRTGS